MNGYKDGFEAGHLDGKKGKSKNYQRHISKLKAIVSGNYVNTFIEGYNEGYRKGIHDKKR